MHGWIKQHINKINMFMAEYHAHYQGKLKVISNSPTNPLRKMFLGGNSATCHIDINLIIGHPETVRASH